ncbi:MAG: hypothetical protein HY074_12660 [Deltaproteobacteria bacterium]|nr:hypothetical protein [Deltaproteobacteria bacterium]
MGITLFYALLCLNAQAQTSPQSNTNGQQNQKPPVPLYYQLNGAGTAPTQTRAEANALATARAAVTNLTTSIQSQVGSVSTVTRGPSAIINTTSPNVDTPPNPPSMDLISNQALNPAAGLMKIDPNSLPANSPLGKPTSPEEEKAAKYLQEQSKKMQESLKDMELSN